MNQFDVVKIIKDDPDNKFFRGQIGTVLELYSHNHYEVEITDEYGRTIFIGAIAGDFLEIV